MTRDEFDGIDIERELRKARPAPSDEFLSRLAARMDAGRQVRRLPVRRPVLALAATAAALIVAGAFGGISSAAYSVVHAVTSIVHVSQKQPPAHHANAGSNQASNSSGATSKPLSGSGPPGTLQPPPKQPLPSQVQYCPPKQLRPCKAPPPP